MRWAERSTSARSTCRTAASSPFARGGTPRPGAKHCGTSMRGAAAHSARSLDLIPTRSTRIISTSTRRCDAPVPGANSGPATLIDAMRLEHALRQVEPDHRDLHRMAHLSDRSLCRVQVTCRALRGSPPQARHRLRRELDLHRCGYILARPDRDMKMHVRDIAKGSLEALHAGLEGSSGLRSPVAVRHLREGIEPQNRRHMVEDRAGDGGASLRTSIEDVSMADRSCPRSAASRIVPGFRGLVIRA